MTGGVASPAMKLLLVLQVFRLLLFVHGIEVVGELNGVVILPCSFTPGKNELIHWTINNEKQKVHSYYNGKDMLNNQDKSYTGRTSLFLDQIKNGNASLQLKKIQKSDENEYSCYVSTIQVERYTVLLKVKAAVWGELHKNVTIPCLFNPGEGIVIHWRITNDDSRIVHRFYQGQDRLESQDKSYKGRTSLILSELANGNASLQLRDLQESDENSYYCYAGTSKGKNEETVKVNVADFGHSMEYTLDHNEPRLKCYASHVYPTDTVTIEWYQENLKIHPDNNSSSRSLCDLTKNSTSCKCIISHSVVQNTWTGTWQTKATERDNVECSCGHCRTVNAEMSVRLYLRKNTTEVLVALVNSSSLVISDGYKSIAHGKSGEYSLHLNNLTANNNGDYICEIRTSDEMFIIMTSVNITDAKENHRGHLWVLLSMFCILFVLFLVFRTTSFTLINSV